MLDLQTVDDFITMDSGTTEKRHCDQCNATEDSSKTLKCCAKCKSAYYCNRDCQKAAWKLHKKTCSMRSQTATDESASSNVSGSNPLLSSTANTRSQTSPDSVPSNPFTTIQEAFAALDNGTWLENRAEADVFKLLVDAYRLRVQDDYKFGGDANEDSLYGNDDPAEGFSRFLRNAERIRKPLPSWWTPAKTLACGSWAEQLMRDGGTWSNLSCAVGKSDIIDHYGHPMFPMQLRMLAEDIIGSPVGGGYLGSGRSTRATMSAAAARNMAMSLVSLS